MKLSICILAILVSTIVFSKEKRHFTTTDTLSAQSIFNKSEAVYANLKIYLDSGKVIEDFDLRKDSFKEAKIFKTAYTNKGQFNFDYYELGKSNSLYTINQTSGAIKAWWGITNEIKTPTSLKIALLTAFGVSHRSSYIIPGLLLVNNLKKQTNIFHTARNITLNGIEILNGVVCYRIDGEEMEKGKISFWIAKKDFLIRKITTEETIDPVKADAFVKKLDSIVMSHHLNDTAYLKKDSTRKAENAKAAALIKSVIPNYKMDTKPFNVRFVYLFMPYTTKKVDLALFKFRPNREVAL